MPSVKSYRRFEIDISDLWEAKVSMTWVVNLLDKHLNERGIQWHSPYRIAIVFDWPSDLPEDEWMLIIPELVNKLALLKTTKGIV